MASRHQAAAAEKAVFYFDDGTLKFAADVEFTGEATRAGIAAYLDALLEELPEEAVEAAARSLSDASSLDFATAWNFLHPPGALEAFLRSLRQGAG